MYSRRKKYFKLLFSTFITIFTAISCLSSSNFTNNSITHQNFDMVNDAMTNIKNKLESEKHKPYLICVKYKFSKKDKSGKEKLIKTTTKSNYKEYREPASYEEKFFTKDSNLNTGKIVEFVYRSSDNKKITEINFLENGNKSKNTIHHEFNIASIA